MSEHKTTVHWQRDDQPFAYETYTRKHHWRFGGGAELDASATKEYLGDASLPNPEEALVVALSSCHALSFLAIAARKRLTVESYDDDAVGHMEKNAEGRLAVTRSSSGRARCSPARAAPARTTCARCTSRPTTSASSRTPCAPRSRFTR
jgi:organic hydroperoxide reductase OsmC/OhrA